MYPRKLHMLTLSLLIGTLLPFTSPLAGSAQEATPDASLDCVEVLSVGNPGDGCVNWVNTLSDGTAVDIVVDGAIAIQGLAFGSTSGFAGLAPGNHQAAVATAGTTDALASFSFDLQSGEAAEIALLGSANDLQPLVLPVDLSPIPPGTPGTPLRKTRVRVVHAVPDAPSVNVSIIGGDIADRVFSDVSYGDATDYIIRNSGKYSVKVDPSDFSIGGLSIGEMQFAPDTVYTFYAIGSVESGELDSLPVAVDLSAYAIANATPVAQASPIPVSQTQAVIQTGPCGDSLYEVAWYLDGEQGGMLAPWLEGSESSGSDSATPVLQAKGTASELNLGDLTGGTVYSVALVDLATGDLVACGEIGGPILRQNQIWKHDRMVVGLTERNGSGLNGVATLVENTGIVTDKLEVTVEMVQSAA